MEKFNDGHKYKIIAFDFDGTLTTDNNYPFIGNPRKYAKEVVNLLHDLGVAVVIWTCRDGDRDTELMIEWLNGNGFKYNAVNNVTEFAPFQYEARKIYAHMYVDDHGFGWEDTEEIMLDVLRRFMIDWLQAEPAFAHYVAYKIKWGSEVDLEWVKRNIVI